MEAPSKPRSTRLTEYLIEQGVGPDPIAKAAIFAKICSGVLPAVFTVHPELPAGASAREIRRYADAEIREVPALSIPKVKTEIVKAALGRDADWTLLDRLTLCVPNAPPVPTRKLLKAVPRELAHRENILAAIKELGRDPTKLPRPNGKRGIKAEVRKRIGSSIQPNAFDKAWEALRAEGSIKDV